MKLFQSIKNRSFISKIIIVASTVYFTNLGLKYLYQSNDKLIEKEVIAMNESLPLIIDEYTRLDSIALIDKKKVKIYYRLLKDELEDIDVEFFKDEMKPIILSNIKADDSNFFKKNNITMVYHYLDKNKDFVENVLITPKDYNQ